MPIAASTLIGKAAMKRRRMWAATVIEDRTNRKGKIRRCHCYLRKKWEDDHPRTTSSKNIWEMSKRSRSWAVNWRNSINIFSRSR
jgi:hypothetical protein